MTDLSELKRLAEAVKPNEWAQNHTGRGIIAVNEKIGGDALICEVRGWGYFTGQGHGGLGLSETEAIARQRAIAAFIAAAKPATILSLIKRVEEAEGAILSAKSVVKHGDKREREAHARGVAEGLERAAKVAEGVDPVSGERGQAWVAHSLYDNMRKHVAAAIRDLAKGGE